MTYSMTVPSRRVTERRLPKASYEYVTAAGRPPTAFDDSSPLAVYVYEEFQV
jgi:hypothetical protein